MHLLRRVYGAGPRHLIAIVIAIAFAVFGWLEIVRSSGGAAPTVAVWFVAAIVAHDLIVLPAYMGLRWAAHRGGRFHRRPHVRAPVFHHLVVPLVISIFLLIVWLPLILGLGFYRGITGLSLEPYLARWGLICAGLFVASGLLYGLRALRARGRPEVALPAEHGTHPGAGEASSPSA